MHTASLDGLQQAVDALATRLGRSVAVDDARGRLVVASRHFGDEDPLRTYAVMQRDSDPRVTAHLDAHDISRWVGPGRVPANTELGFKARVCCPVRAHGIPFGHLFLIDDGVEEHEIELAAAVADEIAAVLHRRLVRHDREHDRRGQLARDLVGDDDAARAAARRVLAGEGHVVDPVAALAVHVTPTAPDTELRAAFDRLTRGRHAGRLLVTTAGRRTTVLVLGPMGHDELRSLGDGLAADLRRTAEAARPVVGIGAPADGPDAARHSHDEAHAAAEAAALLPVLGDVVGIGDLGVYAVLLALPREALSEDRLPAGLRRLLAHDNESLVQTLEVYLDQCGDAARTARALHVHRSTLYYRLGRIETIGQVDLHDGAQRLALHLGLALRRLLDARARDGGRGGS